MDHPGVPNAQLGKENTRRAQIFKESVAEQNSVELACAMLMGEEYDALRACIYNTEEDLRRFRQLVVNTVMATDIVDKELLIIQDESSNDCKATIVIEHLIQASDVSHTMQHWHIYKTWNEKFFLECYGAFKAGRADSDPSMKWKRGESGFFDFYVIPLARKLESCGVFAVSSHEYLNYARSNRAEWAREGGKLIEESFQKPKAKPGDVFPMELGIDDPTSLSLMSRTESRCRDPIELGIRPVGMGPVMLFPKARVVAALKG
eukprot:scaffold1700_cov91-Cylindrotheca_fusiformis.AAC.1